MPRRRRLERRGRPKKAKSARRTIDPLDHGTPELLSHRAAATGSTDLPADLPGALFGRGYLDADEYRALCVFVGLVRLVRRGYGLADGSVSGAWRNILSGTAGRLGAETPSGAEYARWCLTLLRDALAAAVFEALSDAADDLVPAAGFDRYLADLRIGCAFIRRRLPRISVDRLA